MKCPYCAEEIKTEAVLCRFCGATKANGDWKPPPPRSEVTAEPARKGRFTLCTAGVLFLISALLELASVTTAVPLFGAVRGGVIAGLYHVAYAGLFIALGLGLLIGKRWGYRLVFVGTGLYTLDRALYLLDRRAVEAQLTAQLEPYQDVLGAVGEGAVLEMLFLFTVLFVACWWGFALYVYMRRDYFRS